MDFESHQDVYQTWLKIFQNQIYDLIINHNLPLANGPGKDSIIMTIEKTTTTVEYESLHVPTKSHKYKDNGLEKIIQIIVSW